MFLNPARRQPRPSFFPSESVKKHTAAMAEIPWTAKLVELALTDLDWKRKLANHLLDTAFKKVTKLIRYYHIAWQGDSHSLAHDFTAEVVVDLMLSKPGDPPDPPLLSKWRDSGDGDGLGAFVYGVARFHVLRWLVKELRRRRLLAEMPEPGHTAAVDESYINRELAIAILHELDTQFTERDRSRFNKLIIEDRSRTEVAEEERVTTGAIDLWYHRSYRPKLIRVCRTLSLPVPPSIDGRGRRP